jgi:uncharacterized protein (UPF0262 family)
MISTDFYEGIRKARPTDLEAIQVRLRGCEGPGQLDTAQVCNRSSSSTALSLLMKLASIWSPPS